ncbi:CCR4-NOT transcription complex subunit 4 [Elysia marginata]|uniref:CCR4-NOT transcription complex subunit 4 n=1 Tax=Elysia marginata TaxID=1093978 RepID=A0AAV4HDM7_9GAST|nr:CCR4-NOT transcription complex subunit 4 [Elysia marginata]
MTNESSLRAADKQSRKAILPKLQVAISQVSNMCDDSAECPLCMEALEIDDHSFFPCTCGYQICRFCWHRIRTDENGLCPACRKQYPEDPAEFKPLTEDELQNIKKERKQKDVQRKQKAAENRKHLANVRVVQRNLVFVVGLSPRLADPEVLKKHEYFGKFGKIHKVVINQSTSYAGSQGPSASAYVTYVKPEDALRAILTVNNVHVEGRTLKTSLGTTKYCSHFLKGSHCQKSDCMYLHELGEEAASFTKDEMQAGKHQEYEQMLIEQFLNAQNSANNHHLSNMKIKKSVSPQAIENPEVLPSLMDMTGDIKHSLPQSVPLLPNPVPIGTSGTSNTNGHVHLNNCGWPLLDSALTTNGKSDHLPNGRVQKAPFRTTTPPGGGGNTTSSNRAVGSGRQRGSNSTTSVDENLISSSNPVGSSRSLSSSPPENEPEVSTHTPQHQATELLQQTPAPAHRGLPLPTPGAAENNTKSNGSASNVPSLSSPQPGNTGGISPPQQQTPAEDSLSVLRPAEVHQISDPNLSAGLVGAIGSNRRPGFLDTDCTQGLSFFGSNLLSSPSIGTSQVSSTSGPQDIPTVALTNQEMSDAIPVSSTTDWSAAFGFNQKEVPQDDDLGFDPCAESFKGLADLIEKENGMQQQQQQQTAVGPSLHHQHFQHSLPGLHMSRLTASPPQSSFHPSHTLAQHSSPLNTQHPPLVRSLPPGFSMSQIQQQQQQLQQQQFFRPEMANSKMLELLPQFAPTHQRFPPHSYHSLPLDLPPQPQPTQQPTQQPQQTQSDLYSMKDMQDQLRSMLPNINISFGALPQQSQQPQASSSSATSSSSSSFHQTQHSQQLNKSWPLSSSPDAWNDPAIVSTSQFTEPAGLFPESAPHWLKSLQQLTECDGPSHRLPFVQQFPLSGGWGTGPHHTHNPPPGFRAPGLPSQQTTDSHQMAEVLQ